MEITEEATKMELTGLSDVPSEMIRQALKDLREIERSDRYAVHMSFWHDVSFHADGKCVVCMAGAVMAQRCDTLRIESPACPEDFTSRDNTKLLAINLLRMGCVKSAIRLMGLSTDFVPTRVDVAEYRADPAAFHQDMTALADMLQKVGL